ncbi:class I mannose-6-phosphate isomerase [Candidatus Solirubrobacter pratensis]|uniref:class I mannose-6-phosphate isomerase n=1 Tax=Candidatus Solirubrobacter pratensis TaxID=1298857 RepID=UPI000403AA3D|nr:class I mannose-6-phosphate isomerase [Candidatus Solirubrobacter pratensis]
MNPQVLPPNVLRHFYAGGPRIAAFRGVTLDSDHMPEEWIGAVNTTFGAANGRGLSHAADGTLVRDAIAAAPEQWLGEAHVGRYGADAALLTKLLDAGQRLPVHFHPGRAFAKRELGLDHGKTEAWIIVEAEPGSTVHVGFKDDVELDTVRDWMGRQASEEMLAAMHELPVRAGDAIFVPAGTPHSIGAGILILELQEPTDLSITLEWTGFQLTEDECHLGLGWDRALPALDRGAWSAQRVAALRGGAGASLLPSAADPYFRAERVRGGETLEAGFSVLLGLSGAGELAGVPVERGSALLVPFAAGPMQLTGDVEAIRCRPPDPSSPEGEW